LYSPEEQLVQLLDTDAGWKVPAAQLVQPEAPPAAYDPVAQFAQPLPLTEYVPLGHAAQLIAPAVEDVPGAQFVQFADPV